MDLTGAPLLVLLAAVLVAAVCFAVWVWPRLAATRLMTVAGRLGVLALVNVAALLVAFAVLNDQFQFFSDWADLVGAASSQAAATSSGGSVSSAVNAAVVPRTTGGSGPASTSRLLSSTDPSSAIYLVTGGLSGVTSQVQVLLPPGYGDPANAHRVYPVLEGFGGYPSTVVQLSSGFAVQSTLAGLAAQHRLADVISVIVQPWTPPGRDTECVDGPGGRARGDQVETWATVDVPGWVRQHFRAAHARTSWATWGISAGAWCASMSSMLHPDQYSATLSFGGYFAPEWGNWHPFPAGDPRATRYDLVAGARAVPPPVAIWAYVSQRDPVAYPSTRALLAVARTPLSVTARIAPSGGHRYTQWTPWFPVALDWLGRNVPGFAWHR